MSWSKQLTNQDFPDGSDSKESACNAGDLSSIPELGRFPGERNDTPLWYSCLENSMDRRAWWSAVHGVAKSQTGLSDFTFTFFHACYNCGGLVVIWDDGGTDTDPSGWFRS